MNTLDELYEPAESKLQLINSFAEKYQLRGKAIADHIGYKCASKERYESLRELFESNSTYIYQSIISERRISIIKLTRPFKTMLGDINFLELSDQKSSGSQKDGFDHVEVYPKEMSFDDLVKYIQDQGEAGEASIKPHHVTHNFSLSDDFTFKIESCALIEKIKKEEIR